MVLAVDIGGTKVIVAVFSANGVLLKNARFLTPDTYKDFLSKFKTQVAILNAHDYTAAGIAIPGVVDREQGIGLSFGNLSWKNVPVQSDLQQFLKCPVTVENDAKAAALFEAKLIIKKFKKVLYVTIGTGIGIAYVKDGVVDTTFGDHGGNQLLLEHRGELAPWESFASGKAILYRFGKEASEITDEKIWEFIAYDIAVGILNLIALFETEVVIIGGGVGAHFDRFGDALKKILSKYATPVLPSPVILQAKRPEEAVIYGCYELVQGAYASYT